MSGMMAVLPLLCCICVCAVCSAGYKKQGDSCVPCDINTFKDTVGNDAACSACADGTVTEGTGKTANSDCSGESELVRLRYTDTLVPPAEPCQSLRIGSPAPTVPPQ